MWRLTSNLYETGDHVFFLFLAFSVSLKVTVIHYIIDLMGSEWKFYLSQTARFDQSPDQVSAV